MDECPGQEDKAQNSCSKHPVPFSMASVDPGPSLQSGLNRFKAKIGPWLRGLAFHKVLFPQQPKQMVLAGAKSQPTAPDLDWPA